MNRLFERARAPTTYLAQASALCRDVRAVGSLDTALKEALGSTPPEELVVVCGSLYLVGEARALLGLP